MSDALRKYRHSPFSDPEILRAALRASKIGFARWLATAPRCAAIRRDGTPCQGFPCKGSDRCRAHLGPARDPSPQRAHASLMRQAWRISPWVVGFTVELPREAEARLAEMLAAAGLRMDWLSPCTADWLRWRFVGLMRSGQLQHGWDAVQGRLRARDAKDGPQPDTRQLQDMPDFTAASEAHCWHPKLTTARPWQPARKGRGRAATHEARDKAAARRLSDYAASQAAWQPSVGPVRLQAAERAMLERAQAIDQRQGSAHMVEAARRAIEGGRLASEREAQAQRDAEVDRLRGEQQAARLAHQQAQADAWYEVGEDGHLVQQRPQQHGQRSTGSAQRRGLATVRTARSQGW